MRREQRPFKVETLKRNRLPPRPLFVEPDDKFASMNADAQYQAALAAAERLFAPPRSLPLEQVGDVVATLEPLVHPKETEREQRVLFPVDQVDTIEKMMDDKRRERVEKMRETRAANKRNAEIMFEQPTINDPPDELVASEEQVVSYDLLHERFAQTPEIVEEPQTVEVVASTEDAEPEEVAPEAENDSEIVPALIQPIVARAPRKTAKRTQPWMPRRLSKWAIHALTRA
jgi:hypothetical protein